MKTYTDYPDNAKIFTRYSEKRFKEQTDFNKNDFLDKQNGEVNFTDPVFRIRFTKEYVKR